MCEKYENLVKLFLEIESPRILKLDGYVHDPKMSPADFIYNFLTDYSDNYVTKDSDGNIVTFAGKHRSLTETFLIVSSYYENYQLKNYFVDFYSVVSRLPKRFWLINCPNIKKPVLYLRDIPIIGFRKDMLPTHDLFPYPVFGELISKENSILFCPIYQLLYDRDVVEFLVGSTYVQVPAAATV